MLGLVPLSDELLDGDDQGSHTSQHAPLNRLPVQDREPGLDLVHPAGTGRREVEMEARILRQPRPYDWMLVGTVVVEDQMDLEPGVAGGYDLEEAQELLVAVPGVGAAGDGAGSNVEGCQERHGAVAHAIVGPALDLPGLHRQQGLGPIQRLDLPLLVDAEHQRALGRMQVEADDVGAVFEAPGAGRLQALLPPGVQHRGGADSDLLGHLPTAPMGVASQRLAQGHADDPRAHLLPKDLGPAPARPVRFQGGKALLLLAGTPQLDGGQRRADASGDLPIRQAFTRQQHDA